MVIVFLLHLTFSILSEYIFFLPASFLEGCSFLPSPPAPTWPNLLAPPEPHSPCNQRCIDSARADGHATLQASTLTLTLNSNSPTYEGPLPTFEDIEHNFGWRVRCGGSYLSHTGSIWLTRLCFSPSEFALLSGLTKQFRRLLPGR